MIDPEIIARLLIVDALRKYREVRSNPDYKHPCVEFSCCRITEEIGELICATTSTSKGRDINRADRMWDEAVDSVAMILSLLCEWPDGLLKEELK